MLKHTFNIIPGIGSLTEKSLWNKGIFTWNDLRNNLYLLNLNKSKKKSIENFLVQANEALITSNISFFTNYIDRKEYWRLFSEFSKSTLFVDIETTGLSLYYDYVTLIGTYDGGSPKFFIKDNNLDEFPDYVKNFDIIVTFNGSLFDIPHIKKQFPDILLPPIHIDLRFLLRSIGISGPMKKIEQQLNIPRPKELNGVGGREAVVFWNQFLKGDNKSLEKLLLYNTYDTLNMQKLLTYCYQEKVKNIKAHMDSSTYQLTFEDNSRKQDTFKVLTQVDNYIPEISIKNSNNDSLEVFSGNEYVTIIQRKLIHKIKLKINDILNKIRKSGYPAISAGIDLTGSEKRASGICILKEEDAFLDLITTDAEIISKVIAFNPSVISIDSPLSLPKGRDCHLDSCECRKFGITRECERILKKRGINSYPCLIQSMQGLTMRGIRLAKAFREKGYNVIESYPGAAQDILGFPRKRVDLKGLEIDLMNMGIKPIAKREIISHDEIDALTSALVGYFYLIGEYEAIGNLEENYLIIPSIM